MQDVGAHKGFLMCTSGFATSNHRAAKALGIELVTMEDIQSDKWHVDVEIPYVYRRNIPKLVLNVAFSLNQEFVDRHQDTGVVTGLKIDTPLSADNGATSRGLKRYVDEEFAARAADAGDGDRVDLRLPGLHAQIAGVWIPCEEFFVDVILEREVYLKYVVPDE